MIFIVVISLFVFPSDWFNTNEILLFFSALQIASRFCAGFLGKIPFRKEKEDFSAPESHWRTLRQKCREASSLLKK